MEKRTPIEVRLAILEACQQPKIKTHLMYGSYICHQSVKKYLPVLIVKNLIRVIEEPGKRIMYKTTTEGHKALRHWREIEKLLKF